MKEFQKRNMKVLSSPENKKIYSEKDIKQFIGLYHLGAINPLDDPVLTGIVLEALHQQHDTIDKPPQTIKLKIFKLCDNNLITALYL